MSVKSFDTNPLALPPGPERRKLMHELGYNIAPSDYTDAELAERKANRRPLPAPVAAATRS